MDTTPRVLVVDDEPLVLRSCDRVLRDEGMRVEGVGTGHEGLNRLEHEAFNLVLLDMKLPDMNGLDILRQIKPTRTGTAVIVITGYPSTDLAIEAMACGASDFVVKPFSPDELIKAATRALGRIEPHRARASVMEAAGARQLAPELGLCRSISITTRRGEKAAIIGLNGSFDSQTGLWRTVTESLASLYVLMTIEYGKHEVTGKEIVNYLENNDRVVVVASAQVGKKPGQFVIHRCGVEPTDEKDAPVNVPQIGLPQLLRWTRAVGIQSELIVIGVQPDEENEFVMLGEAAGLTHEVMRQALCEELWYRY